MRLLPRFELGSAFRDLILFLKTRQKHDYIILAISLGITGFIVYAINKDSYFERAVPITYVENFPANRTDAEIEKGNIERSKARHAAEDERRREFRKLADQLGIEVDNKQ